MRQHVKQVAFLGVNDFLHLGQLVVAETFFGQSLQELGPRVRRTPQLRKFFFVMEKVGQLAKKHFHELLRGHRRAVGMPERGRHHVLDVAFLAVGEFHFRFVFFCRRNGACRKPGMVLSDIRTELAAHRARLWRLHFADTRPLTALRARFFFRSRPIPGPGNEDAPSQNRKS